ncbi:RNA-binding protein [Cupriavidus sp. WKF15]|uniref:RNA-binding protein n=1 Tax=Cupriavidus sp. WKF15 TaxID=3032282 RepID=UPI0023E2534A|nr:RNA-binding protein [Cupriavidus sp. WKF15]WER50367.1 RNA-binding protein [Cupriavidus sp. WKF15]
MTHLLLSNLEPGTTDDEVRAFIHKYGLPPCDAIERVPGDGTHPSVVLDFNDLDPEALHKYAERIHHMLWKSRELTAQVLTERFL